LPWWY